MADVPEAPRYLREVMVDWASVPDRRAYPFDLPGVRDLETLALHPAVTYFVGENGSGKSTLLEAIAVGMGFNAEGGGRNFRHSTRASHSVLHEHLRLRKGFSPRDGFFLRAESYFNLATNIEDLDNDPDNNRGLPIINSYGGRSLHEQSHGESFFALFMNRFGGEGLYLLDEPESALSPARQMAFLTRLHDLVARGAQFIIATHSPIVLAYPQAAIHELSGDGIERVAYEQTQTVQTMKRFLDRRESMLRTLLGRD